ncbi:MAG: hypothetical protein ACR2NA_03740 [Solirubrobacterales bacterium]
MAEDDQKQSATQDGSDSQGSGSDSEQTSADARARSAYADPESDRVAQVITNRTFLLISVVGFVLVFIAGIALVGNPFVALGLGLGFIFGVFAYYWFQAGGDVPG